MASPGVLLHDIELGFTGNRAGYLPVMSGLDLSVGPTEFVAIVGPSGCGKSTLLRAISGLQPLQGGDIRWPQAQTARGRLRSALVFQSPRLLPWRTVRQNVAYGLEALGVAKPEAGRRSLELLSTVGLADFADAYPRQLSGGMQQRVNLARALVVDPDVILLDEPFASLDAQTREGMQGYLSRVWQQGQKAALLVTHQVDEAVYLADRVIVLSKRPSRIVKEVIIDIPRPRDVRDKRSDRYRRLEDQIWRALEPSLEAIR
jgi:NitT/TauT family transport system ATP-binding protein